MRRCSGGTEKAPAPRNPRETWRASPATDHCHSDRLRRGHSPLVPYGDCWSTLCCLAVWSIWVESSTALGGFRVLKKTSEAPYTTKVNYRVRTTRGTTLYTPSRVFVARPARSAARLVGHAAAAQTRRVQPASLLQAHLQVRRSTRFLGQLYKSGFGWFHEWFTQKPDKTLVREKRKPGRVSTPRAWSIDMRHSSAARTPPRAVPPSNRRDHEAARSNSRAALVSASVVDGRHVDDGGDQAARSPLARHRHHGQRLSYEY